MILRDRRYKETILGNLFFGEKINRESDKQKKTRHWDGVKDKTLGCIIKEHKTLGWSGFQTTRRIQRKRRSGSLKMNLVFIPISSSLVKLGAG